MNIITRDLFDSGYSYEAYRNLVDVALSNSKTTGPVQSTELTTYTKLNVQRMNRLDKTVVLNEDLIYHARVIAEKQYWLVITEGWCGDAAQSLPVIAKLAEVNNLIDLRFILRDEHLEIMDQFLTNGTRSIPKLIVMNKDFAVLKHWGPRPQIAHAMVLALKASGRPHDEWVEEVHAWYAQDKTKSLQEELVAFIQ